MGILEEPRGGRRRAAGRGKRMGQNWQDGRDHLFFKRTAWHVRHIRRHGKAVVAADRAVLDPILDQDLGRFALGRGPEAWVEGFDVIQAHVSTPVGRKDFRGTLAFIDQRSIARPGRIERDEDRLIVNTDGLRQLTQEATIVIFFLRAGLMGFAGTGRYRAVNDETSRAVLGHLGEAGIVSLHIR